MKNIYMFHYSVKALNTLPYGCGQLWAYANQDEKIAQNYQLKGLFWKFEEPDDILDQIEDPDVCAFSTYIWNVSTHLEVAQRIKEKYPDCLIVFGGPEISADMLKYEQIDILVMGEGEDPFKKVLLDRLNGRETSRLLSMPILQSLDDLPSPYTTGVFDDIVKKNPDVLWRMIYETDRGCPYSCTFCAWGETNGKIKRMNMARCFEEMDWLDKNNVKHLFIADANFGIFKDRSLEIAERIRESYGDGSNPLQLVTLLGSTKNNPEQAFAIARTIKTDTNTFTVSLQSLHKPTLEAIKRKNITDNRLVDVMEMATDDNVYVMIELMLGLPLETLDTWKDGYNLLLEAGHHSDISTYPVFILTNTEMNDPTYIKKYGLETGKAPSENSKGGTLINKTNTMSTQDIIDAYMFGWCINTVHTKFTKHIAIHAFEDYGIDYRTFYETLLKRYTAEDSPYIENVKYTLSEVTEIFTAGWKAESWSGGSISNQTVEHILSVGADKIWQMGVDVFRELTNAELSQEVADLEPLEWVTDLFDY